MAATLDRAIRTKLSSEISARVNVPSTSTNSGTASLTATGRSNSMGHAPFRCELLEPGRDWNGSHDEQERDRGITVADDDISGRVDQPESRDRRGEDPFAGVGNERQAEGREEEQGVG